MAWGLASLCLAFRGSQSLHHPLPLKCHALARCFHRRQAITQPLPCVSTSLQCRPLAAECGFCHASRNSARRSRGTIRLPLPRRFVALARFFRPWADPPIHDRIIHWNADRFGCVNPRFRSLDLAPRLLFPLSRARRLLHGCLRLLSVCRGCRRGLVAASLIDALRQARPL